MRKARRSGRQAGVLQALGLGRGGKMRQARAAGAKRHRGRGFFFEPLEPRTLLSVCIWEGGGSNTHWSNAANWAGGVVPGAGDDLVFRGTEPTQTENDLLAGTAFRSLSFQSSDFSIAGNAFAVTRRIFVGPDADGATIEADIALDGAVRVTLAGGSLSLLGAVSGNGSLIENGNGTKRTGMIDRRSAAGRMPSRLD